MTAQRKTVEVVAGLAWRPDGTVFLGKRLPTAKRGDLWEMPGGKVEPDERQLDALVREWNEELGVPVEIGDFVTFCRLSLEVELVVHLWEVKMLEGAVPMLRDHSEHRWVSLNHAIQFMPCSPALYLHYPITKGWLAKRVKR